MTVFYSCQRIAENCHENMINIYRRRFLAWKYGLRSFDIGRLAEELHLY